MTTTSDSTHLPRPQWQGITTFFVLLRARNLLPSYRQYHALPVEDLRERRNPADDSRTQGYFRGPSPQNAALRGVMQALVRIQAYMLADMVVAIPAVDLAVV